MFLHDLGLGNTLQKVRGSFSNKTNLMGGRVAQLGEHLPYKQGVAGSSPVPPTTGGGVV